LSCPPTRRQRVELCPRIAGRCDPICGSSRQGPHQHAAGTPRLLNIWPIKALLAVFGEGQPWVAARRRSAWDNEGAVQPGRVAMVSLMSVINRDAFRTPAMSEQGACRPAAQIAYLAADHGAA
jgi:hypothetical protein